MMLHGRSQEFAI